MWNHMDYYGWGGMGFCMLLFWGLLIVGIVAGEMFRGLWETGTR